MVFRRLLWAVLSFPKGAFLWIYFFIASFVRSSVVQSFGLYWKNKLFLRSILPKQCFRLNRILVLFQILWHRYRETLERYQCKGKCLRLRLVVCSWYLWALLTDFSGDFRVYRNIEILFCMSLKSWIFLRQTCLS